MSEKTLALVLDKKEFREKDLIFTLLTPYFGKISALAKSSRVPQSKLRAHLERGFLSEIELVNWKGSYIIASASRIRSFVKIPYLWKLKVVLEILGFLCSFNFDFDSSKESNFLFGFSLKTLSQIYKEKDKKIIEKIFWQFIASLFLIKYPKLENCSVCGQNILDREKIFWLDLKEFSFKCSSCASKVSQNYLMSLKNFNLLLKKEYPDYLEVRKNLSLINKILKSYEA